MRFLCKLALAVLAGFVALPATAHEFWLEPEDFTPERGVDVVINHNYGQNFKGDGLPYVADWHERYFVAEIRSERPILGFDGDLPAVTMRFLKPGLKILAYDGTPENQSFETFAKFEAFLAKAGLAHIAERHRALGKPETDITERFARQAKLLLGVGADTEAVRGRDRAVGLRLELVADRNPYRLKPGERLPVRLLFDGEPIADVTIHAFNRQDPENPVKTTTDAEGRADIALPVSGPYLLSAIHMFESPPSDTADWSSLWASLTFAIP